MARLLIVSRSMALAMRLADQHDVNEHPVDDLETLGTDIDADVLVLDIGDPMQAVTTVNTLREAGQVTPVLLVSGYQPEWEQVEAQQVEGVVVVPLPITRAALLAGIVELIGPSEPELDTPEATQPAHDGDTSQPQDSTEEAQDDAGPRPGPADNGRSRLGESPDGAVNGTSETGTPNGKAPETTPSTAPATPIGVTANGTAGPAREATMPGEDSEAEPDADEGANEDEVEETDGPEPGSPDWVTPVAPGGIADFAKSTTPTAAPPSPPWGETLRVGPPAMRGGQGTGASTAQNAAGNASTSPQIPGLAAGQAVYQALSEQSHEAGPDTGSNDVLGPPSRRLPRLGNRPRKLQRRPSVNDTQGLVTDPLGPRTDPYGVPSGNTGPNAIVSAAPAGASALDRRLDSDAAALVGDRPNRNRSASGIVMRPADLVQSLLDQVGDLYGVSDTAQVLADDVIERADADAAAVLVPDGPIWRVSGGVGLRPLERRLILESTHWLITEIGAAGRAVLIDDTDIIRPQLAGAPLAAWRHLLAVPVPDVRAIVVLARGQEAGPFTDRDLAAVIAPVREAATLLAQAVQTRRLARALSSLREADTDASPRRRDS